MVGAPVRRARAARAASEEPVGAVEEPMLFDEDPAGDGGSAGDGGLEDLLLEAGDVPEVSEEVIEAVPRRVYRARRYPKDPDVMAEILERLSGGELLKDICSEARRLAEPGWPPPHVVYQWRREEPEGFGAEYLDAQRAGLERRAERLLDIAADEARDFRVNDHGRVVFNGHAVRRAECMINTEKWYLGKMLPDIYGDRPEVRGVQVGALDGATEGELAAELVRLIGPEAAALMAGVDPGVVEGRAVVVRDGGDEG